MGRACCRARAFTSREPCYLVTRDVTSPDPTPPPPPIPPPPFPPPPPPMHHWVTRFTMTCAHTAVCSARVLLVAGAPLLCLMCAACVQCVLPACYASYACCLRAMCAACVLCVLPACYACCLRAMCAAYVLCVLRTCYACRVLHCKPCAVQATACALLCAAIVVPAVVSGVWESCGVVFVCGSGVYSGVSVWKWCGACVGVVWCVLCGGM